VRRPLPEHFKRDGRPKKPLTQSEARLAAARDNMRAYRCTFCAHWHVGGRPS
jgi:hypothetical protein